MSALVGSISKDITFNPVMEKEKNKDGEPTHESGDDDDSETHDEEGHEEEEEDSAADEDGKPKSEVKLEGKELEVGPQLSLKEQLDKDKVYSLPFCMPHIEMYYVLMILLSFAAFQRMTRV